MAVVSGDEVARARALLRLHEQLGAEHDVTALLRVACSATCDLLGEAAGVWTMDGDLVSFTRGAHDLLPVAQDVATRCGAGDGLVSHAVAAGTVLALDRDEVLAAVPAGQRAAVEAFGVTGVLLAPLLSRGRGLGALGVVRTSPAPFRPEDHDLLAQLARVVALTLANAQLLEEVDHARHRATMLAREDVLTGLLNRRGFLDLLREHEGPPPLVAVFDVDGFRLVNDGFGHAAGDMVLASMAARLCASLPPQTPVARIGGDEFAALVSAADLGQAAEVVAHAARACTGTLQVVGLSVPVAVSVGTAVPEAGRAEDALQHADLAMARAKHAGSAVAAYDPALDDPATRRLREVLELRRSILGGDLVVHYQPVVPVGDGPLRVEALVRRSVGDTLLLPAAWLDTADRAGLMPEVTAAVITQVVEQLSAWWAAGLEIECAVNVPAPVLAAPGLVNDLLRQLDEAGLPRRALSVEVTEGDLVGPQAREALTRCAEERIAVAVDDFGTGWSALSYLVDLPLDTVKLDKSFVDGIDLDIRRAAVVRAVVEVAHELGLRVVAEGVETQPVADLVIDLGADALQGFLYSRPAAADLLEPLLRGGLLIARR